MNLHDLSMFVHVYESGSMTRTAQERFVSRQALSRSILQLEREVGTLFAREPRGVAPTALADAVYPHARQAVEACAAIGAEAARFASGQAGVLSLALEASAALTLPPGLLDAYARARPQVELRIKSCHGSDAFRALEAGQVGAVIAGPAASEGLKFELIFANTISFVFSRAAFPELGPAEPGGPAVLDVSAVSGKTLFGVAPDNHVERMLIPFLTQRGIDVTLRYDRTDTALATSEMEAGMGGVIAEDGAVAARFAGERYVHVPLRGPDAPTWEVGISYRPDDPCAPLAHDLAAFAQDYGRAPAQPVAAG